jgi:hypothetical protein
MVVTIEFSGFVDILNVFKKEGPGGKKTRKKHSDLAKKHYKDACARHASKENDRLH